MYERYWEDIPVGREKAVSYTELCCKWEMNERRVRRMLHDLSYYDNGDPYILIRSSHGKGFYKTDNDVEIERYKKECINRAKHTFAPLRKIKRVLNERNQQKLFNL